MHLSIVSPFPPSVTGIGQYGYHISQALARCGAFDRVTVLTEIPAGMSSGRAPWPADVAAAEKRPASLRLERIWRPGRLDAGWQVARRLRQLKPDLVWYNLGASIFGRSPFGNLSGLCSPAITRMSGLPCVVTLHEMVGQADLQALEAPGGPLAASGARLITWLGTQADLVCVTLRRHADWLRLNRPGVPLMHIPHSGSDRPQQIPGGEAPELLIFTTYAPFKGLELLLKAFSELQGRIPGLRLTVAGAEHPRTPGYVGRVRAAFGENPAVSWLGCVPEADLPAIFGRAAIVVLPYTATTGSSSVLFRAAAWGRAVVCSDLAELCAAAGEAGLQAEFFRSGDAGSLAAALGRLLDEPRLRHAQVAHNLRALEQATPEAITHAYLRAFNLALGARHSPLRAAAPAAFPAARQPVPAPVQSGQEAA